MLKKISLEQVRVGMYIDHVEGRLADASLRQQSFRLMYQKDLVSLRSRDLDAVWIDTEKGLDVEPENLSETSVEKIEQAAEKSKEIAKIRTLSFDEEIEQARRIQTMATREITSMFQEVRMGRAIDAESAASVTNEIYLSVMRNPGALISLSRLKTVDDYTYMHSVAVCGLMIALGRKMGLDEKTIRPLGMAGLLHDIGKMAVPDSILNKPGSLTDEEFRVIQSHPVKGWEMLKESDSVDDIALDVCLHHHEKTNGTGYPEKLSDEQISLYAKMGAVCDVYDAITSNRSYKKGWTPADSIRKMASWKSGHFDEKVFDHFVQVIGIYPTGTLLKLQSGRLAIVVDQGRSLLKPVVKIIYSTTAGAPLAPKMIDLNKSTETIESIADPSLYPIDINAILGFTG